MVNWKAIPKIDAHIHLLPEDVIRANSGCGDPFVENGSLSDYLSLMEAYNIECAFLMPFNDPCMLSMNFTVETVHSNLRQMADSSCARVKCFADVDIRRDIAFTLEELDRILAQEQFVGIKLHPTNAGYPVDGAYYERIFQYANDTGTLVELHSYPREHLKDDLCSPRRIRNVLNRYPKLRVSIAHLGGFQYEELLGLNAYFNISAILPDLVGRVGLRQANRILRSIGTDRLVFATDYPDSRSLKPAEIYGKYFEILGEMDFSKREAEQICKDNALAMIGR